MTKPAKPSPEQLYKTLMIKFIESGETPPCDNRTEVFFADGVDWQVRIRDREAKMLCGFCPFKQECLTYALAAREPYGIWGGLTTAERQTLLKSMDRVSVAQLR